MIDLHAYITTVREVAIRAAYHPADRRNLAALLLGFPAWQTLVRGGRALDHIVARAHLDQPIERPVFIVGHQRSGTTFLHRLLALDPRFATPKAWQLLLPAASLLRVVEAGARIERPRWTRVLEHRLFGKMATRHETGWTLPEEDDWLFLHNAATPTLSFLNAKPLTTRRYWVGDDLSADERASAMRWYRRSVQRFLLGAPAHATWLSKNPHFTGWIRTLSHTFPDARFIMLVRDPAEAIASRLSMLTQTWGQHVSRTDPRLQQVFRSSCRVYRHAESTWAALRPAQRIRVPYNRLVQDPEAVAQGIYSHFGWQMAPTVAHRLAHAAAEARRRVPGPRPKLRQFGIRASQIADELGELTPLWQSLGQQPPRGGSKR